MWKLRSEIKYYELMIRGFPELLVLERVQLDKN